MKGKCGPSDVSKQAEGKIQKAQLQRKDFYSRKKEAHPRLSCVVQPKETSDLCKAQEN